MAQEYISLALKNLVIARAGGRCEYCKSPAEFATQSFTIEHILAYSKGGSGVEDNLALACGGCNAHKSDRTEAIDPLDGSTVRLFNPRLDKWNDHFEWSENFSKIIGKTPIGRAMIDALRMNRSGLMNLRLALVSYRKHPPQQSE
jgi:hypothetical protein